MASGGFVGKILRVDLTQRKVREEETDKGIISLFGGQIGIGVKMMYDEVPPGVKATDPENRLIFMTGPFTGTGVQSPSNFQVISLNPITGCHFAIGNSHGFWGARLKFAGYDGVVIQGRADRPSYLWIHDGECEIRDARGLWGKTDTFETEDVIRKQLGQERASVAAIGPAGERLCASAMVENDHGHVAAKGNIGIVMGSKNLKAVAVSGTKKVPVANPAEFRLLGKKWREESFETPVGKSVNDHGTAGFLPGQYRIGRLPIRNLTAFDFPEYEKLSGQYMRATHQMKRNPCYGCSIAHCHQMTVTEGPYKGFVGEEPENEDMTNLGSLIGIADAGTVAWLTDYVDRLGFDSNWAGSIVSWAMEAYEKGILTKDALNGLELRWGDEKAAAELLRRIAYREGIGDTLALGLKTGPLKFGGERSAAFAVHIKGETNHAYDHRATWGQLLGLCVSGGGPRWEAGGGAPSFVVKGRAEEARTSQIKKLFHDTLGVCMFGFVNVEIMVEAYAALTGLPLSVDDALLMGERIANMQRAFNIRHGFRPEMDVDVSQRLLEPPAAGAAMGQSIAPHLKDLVVEYNRLMDWDWETGRPSQNKLRELGMDALIEDLYG